LLREEALPVALAPDAVGDCWSGSKVRRLRQVPPRELWQTPDARCQREPNERQPRR